MNEPKDEPSLEGCASFIGFLITIFILIGIAFPPILFILGGIGIVVWLSNSSPKSS